MPDLAHDMWKSRGRELNAIYDTLSRTMRAVLPRGGAPTAIPSAEAACHDIEALGAEVERLRENVDELRATLVGIARLHPDDAVTASIARSIATTALDRVPASTAQEPSA